jgi:HlyD family secretion protein/epimerase transport system membrane fusion protein
VSIEVSNENATRVERTVSTRSGGKGGSALSDRMLTGINTQKRIAFALIALFFGGLVAWSLVFPLASAAIAPGIVSPEGARRPVQHLEGGIIAEVLVRDGDRVIKGQPLIVLRETRAKAQVNQLLDQRSILQMRLRRLLAERRLEEVFEPGVNDIKTPDPIGPHDQESGKGDFLGPVDSINPGLAKAHDAMRSKQLATMKHTDGTIGRELRASLRPELSNALDMEFEIFRSRREGLLSRERILQTRLLQLGEEIQGLKDLIVSIDDQLALIKDEAKDAKTLFDKGLVPKPRLLALQRQQAELEGQRASATARIAQANQSISETQAQISNQQTAYVETADREMSEVRSELVEIVNQLLTSEDVLARTTLTAPDSGIVVGLTATAENAVVTPGDIILEIVPEDAALLIDVRVSPLDIDDVREGQMAQVHLLAYKQRHMPRFDGTVRYVSADSLTDEQTGTNYFLARVAVDENVLHELAPDVDVIPGMPAEVMIETGEQTVFDYLIGPLNQTLRRSFREK